VLIQTDHLDKNEKRKEEENTHPLQTPLHTQLLRTNKAPDSNRDSQIDIVGANVLPQMHLRARFGHPNHALQMTDRDGE
jgi:hypothetical protein